MSRRGHQGFTLIELLVVIAIIAILAAILFPVFARARATAETSTCVSNLKQIGNGITLYLDDYNGRFPNAVGGWGPPPAAPAANLVTTLKKYVKVNVEQYPNATSGRYFKTVGVFACPSDHGTRVMPYKIGNVEYQYNPTWWVNGTSYEYYADDRKDSNNSLPPQPGLPSHNSGDTIKYSGLTANLTINGVTARVGAPMSMIRLPSKKTVASDICWVSHATNDKFDRDRATRNTLFADGHACTAKFIDWELGTLYPLGSWY